MKRRWKRRRQLERELARLELEARTLRAELERLQDRNAQLRLEAGSASPSDPAYVAVQVLAALAR